MKILIGDTCLKTASAIIVNGKKILAYMQSFGEEPHSVMFPKLVDQVLNIAETDFNSLDAVACVYGPGSLFQIPINFFCYFFTTAHSDY
jgi:tRNA A37 threonylcarbamoyladenosine modification protein TsaB